ncbi:MAG TPA: TetR/AcrR family transcriptional regulator [Thermomicrobiales bacterium]|jgi:AcrR family transcriptional regulator
MTRKYELKRRAEQQAATRQRIVEATVALHEAIGGEATTIAAIAERAGVGRLTVYRHFPDERALLTACTGHYLALNPPPDPAAWAGIADPATRLRVALGEAYVYYRRTAGMLARAEQEAPTNPILADLMAPFAAFWESVRDGLVQGWGCADAPEPILVAAVGHALAFSTWRSLVQEQGLEDGQAADLMVALVRCAPWHDDT